MLSKKYRVRKNPEFKEIFKSNRKIYTPYFVILIKDIKDSNLTENMSLPKFGFIVSKKLGKAVVRNRIKRILKEIIRLELSSLAANLTAVIIASPQITELNFHELQNLIKEKFLKAKLYKKV